LSVGWATWLHADCFKHAHSETQSYKSNNISTETGTLIKCGFVTLLLSKASRMANKRINEGKSIQETILKTISVKIYHIGNDKGHEIV
jgi:hypothetical protein